MLDKLKAKYVAAKKAYYNNDGTKPLLMTDAEFDALEDKIRSLEPKWSGLKKTGTKVGKKVEVALHEFMPSLAKAYPDKIGAWVTKSFNTPTCTVMAKLDGSSLQLVYESGKLTHIITRGDGVNGKEITFLAPYLSVPKKIAHYGKLVLRAEAVMTDKNFERYSEEFDNARAMVNGILNRQSPHTGLTKVDIVVLSVINSPITKLDFVETLGFKTVMRRKVKHAGVDWADLLSKFKEKCEYTIDGLVLIGNTTPVVYENADRPKFMVAYKDNNEADALTATVKDIIWQTAASGRLTPKVKLVPIQVGAVTVTHATLHNAQWMVERKIGVGAKVKLVRSGDTIPKILSVVKSGTLVMPSVPYKKRGVHFVVASKSDEAAIGVLVKFCMYLGIDGIKVGMAQKLYNSGYTTPYDLMNVAIHGNSKLLEQSVGLGAITARNIHTELHRVLSKPLAMKHLMLASNSFENIGLRKLTALETARGHDFLNVLVKELLTSSKGLNTDKAVRAVIAKFDLTSVPSYSTKTVEILTHGLVTFVPWLRKALKFVSVAKSKVPESKKKVIDGKLSGMYVSFTGYRSADEKTAIEAAGGTVVDFSSKTQILLYKASGKASGKLTKARDAGIKVMTFDKLGV